MTDNRQMQEYMEALLRKGLRITPQRKYMLQLVLGMTAPFAAVEMYEQMKLRFHGMSYGTVYQNLRLFAKLRIVESFAIVGEVRYRLVEPTQPKLNFTCMDCDTSVDLAYQPEQLALLLPNSYTSVGYKLDVYGYCLDCNDAKAKHDTIRTFNLGGMHHDDQSNRNRSKS